MPTWVPIEIAVHMVPSLPDYLAAWEALMRHKELSPKWTVKASGDMWTNLVSGTVLAMGDPGSGRLENIPALEWMQLEMVPEGGVATLDRAVRWRNVFVSGADLLRAAGLAPKVIEAEPEPTARLPPLKTLIAETLARREDAGIALPGVRAEAKAIKAELEAAGREASYDHVRHCIAEQRRAAGTQP